MLFNTLGSAQFFCVVFVVSWLLIDRRWALLLPWVGLALHVGSQSLNPQSALVCAGALGLTLALRPAIGSGNNPETERLGLKRAVTAIFLNFLAFAWLAGPGMLVDPLGTALRALGVPVPSGTLWAVAGWSGGFAVLLSLVRARKVRLLFILGASYVFYAHWDWRFLPLIFGSSTIDWWLGNAIGRAEDPTVRKRWLGVTVTLNLGVLAVFKYFNFGIDNARSLLTQFGYDAPELSLQIALPVAISFFTFESMSYVIDVYRRELEPQESYVEYLSFVAFFPHLVAGPIVRPRDLLPQLAGPPRFSGKVGSEALFLIALGLFKKIAIGDYLGLNLVDRVFDAPAQYSALECYTAVVGYALQIYCDFSGYTDVAIGSALLLGVRFPLNFNSPYKAATIQDFWRRWHISLSTWLRAYLYIPLGGNRSGGARTYLNLMLTMLLGGLWHGANWTFVVWGGLHGGGLALERYFTRKRKPRTSEAGAPRHLLQVCLTFHFVCIAWIFFRAEHFQKAQLMFSQMITLSTYHPNRDNRVLAVLALGLIGHYVPDTSVDRVQKGFTEAHPAVQGALLFAIAIAIRKMASAQAVPFVYFQF